MANDETGIVEVVNPFPVTPITSDINAGTVSIESERAIAEVKAAYTIAKMFPRNKFQAMEKILDTCKRLDFAQGALYAYPRGGQKIEGLSIRAAEVIANAWGNVRWGIKELSQSNGESEMLAFCVDLETNSESVQTFTFKHERYTTSGVKPLTDPRDIYEMGANYGARRLRARILAVVDRDVVAAAERQIRATLLASVSGDNRKSLPEKMAALVAEFGKIGVKVKLIEARIGHPIVDAVPDDWTDLATVYKSLKDGISHMSDWFDVPKTTTASEAAANIDKQLSKPSEPAQEAFTSADPTDGLRAKCKSLLETRFKSATARETFSKQHLGDTSVDAANVDQLTVLREALEATTTAGAAESSFDAAMAG